MSFQQVAHHRRRTGGSLGTARQASTDAGRPIVHRHTDVGRLVDSSMSGAMSGRSDATRRGAAVQAEGRL